MRRRTIGGGRGPAAGLLATFAVVVGAVLGSVSGAADAAPGPTVTVARTGVVSPRAAAAGEQILERREIGRSVQGRPILAWRLGEPGKPVAVLISTMHGNEDDTRHLLHAIRRGPAIAGLDLWVIPTYNPDGLAARSRRNAHGVDLNRNFPYDWADLDGNYESGPGPASEPETKAVMAFLDQVRPHRILSFHQPLFGVDTDTKRPGFARRVAAALRLPRTTLDCGGVCHGTMTGWFNHNFEGAALTVEYQARPPRRKLTVTDPPRVVAVLGGVYVEEISAAP